MFRKLVSNLAFSPALITQVGFYARRLRQEEITRRLTVVFVVLSLIVQSLAVFSPPESANASSEQDILRGGVQDIDDLLARYDSNSDDLRDIYTTVGITRDEIAAATRGTVSANEDAYLMSRYGQFSPDDGEVSFTYQRSAGGEGIRHFSPMKLSSPYTGTARPLDAWIGQSQQSGWFALIKSSAGVALKELPSTLPLNPVDQVVSRNLTVTNVTQAADALNVKAQPKDKLSYLLSATNTSSTPATVQFTLRLADILEYGTLVDAGGADFDTSSQLLSWPAVSLKPGESQTRTFVAELFSTLPATGVGAADKTSFDCVLSATFGSTSQVGVNCPSIKVVESAISELPTAGIVANAIFSVGLLATAIYFYARTRQMKYEIRLIRHNINTGII